MGARLGRGSAPIVVPGDGAGILSSTRASGVASGRAFSDPASSVDPTRTDCRPRRNAASRTAAASATTSATSTRRGTATVPERGPMAAL
jgi:hypothetical protein